MFGFETFIDFAVFGKSFSLRFIVNTVFITSTAVEVSRDSAAESYLTEYEVEFLSSLGIMAHHSPQPKIQSSGSSTPPLPQRRAGPEQNVRVKSTPIPQNGGEAGDPVAAVRCGWISTAYSLMPTTHEA